MVTAMPGLQRSIWSLMFHGGFLLSYTNMLTSYMYVCVRGHNLFLKYFFSHIRHCSFDLLTVTFQGQTFFDNP